VAADTKGGGSIVHTSLVFMKRKSARVYLYRSEEEKGGAGKGARDFKTLADNELRKTEGVTIRHGAECVQNHHCEKKTIKAEGWAEVSCARQEISEGQKTLEIYPQGKIKEIVKKEIQKQGGGKKEDTLGERLCRTSREKIEGMKGIPAS